MKRKPFLTKRLILRPYRLSDHASWREARLGALPKQNKSDLGPLKAAQVTKTKFIQIMKRQERQARDDDGYIYAVVLKSTGQVIGIVDIFILVRSTYQMANLGYMIYNQFWGHGYGREAAAGAMRIGFQHLKLNRLEAVVNLDNTRSKKLARAIGMKSEGIRRRYIFENGRWTDRAVFIAIPQDLGLKPVSKMYEH